MADNIEIVVKAVDNFSGVFGDLGNIMTGIKSTIDLVSGAFNAATDFVGQFVDSASESQMAVTGLETVLKSTGDTVKLTSGQLQGMANDLQKVTMYSDEQVIAAETMLLRFENLNNILPESLQLTTDYAAALGIDLTSAAQTIGKALDDPASGIGRLNMQFKLFNETEMTTIKTMAENGDVAGAQALIMDRLREKVGGAAEAFGSTYAGQLEIAKNAMDNLKESIGNAFLPVLTQMTQGIIDFVNNPEIQSFVNDFAGKLSDLFAGLKSGSISFVDLTSIFKDWITSIDWNSLSQDIANGLNSIDWKAVSAGLGNLSDAFTTILIQIDWSAIAGAIWESLIQGFMVVIDNGANTLIRLLADTFTKGDISILQDKVKTMFSFGWDDIGIAIVDGIKVGITWAWGNLKALFSFGFDDIISYVKDILGISSPSTIFMDIGRNIVQGLWLGISSMWATLVSDVTKLIQNLLKPFQPLLDILGINTSLGGTAGGNSGSVSLGSAGGGIGSTLPTGQVVNNYFYGPVYFSQGLDNTNYDCPSPNPFMNATNGSLSTSGI